MDRPSGAVTLSKLSSLKKMIEQVPTVFSHLKDRIYLVVFLPCLYKGDNCYHLICFPAYQVPSKKGVNSKRKEFASKEANSFLLELTPFQKDGKSILTELSPLKVYIFPLNNIFAWRGAYNLPIHEPTRTHLLQDHAFKVSFNNAVNIQ